MIDAVCVVASAGTASNSAAHTDHFKNEETRDLNSVLDSDTIVRRGKVASRGSRLSAEWMVKLANTPLVSTLLATINLAIISIAPSLEHSK